jgi:hypothetical protein
MHQELRSEPVPQLGLDQTIEKMSFSTSRSVETAAEPTLTCQACSTLFRFFVPSIYMISFIFIDIGTVELWNRGIHHNGRKGWMTLIAFRAHARATLFQRSAFHGQCFHGVTRNRGQNVPEQAY